MNIESDTLRYDDAKQTSVFTGKVVLTKGTIVIRGARIDVRQDPEGYQYGTVLSEPGKLAFFRQKREGLDEFIEGEAETTLYIPFDWILEAKLVLDDKLMKHGAEERAARLQSETDTDHES